MDTDMEKTKQLQLDSDLESPTLLQEGKLEGIKRKEQIRERL